MASPDVVFTTPVVACIVFLAICFERSCTTSDTEQANTTGSSGSPAGYTDHSAFSWFYDRTFSSKATFQPAGSTYRNTVSRSYQRSNPNPQPTKYSDYNAVPSSNHRKYSSKATLQQTFHNRNTTSTSAFPATLLPNYVAIGDDDTFDVDRCFTDKPLLYDFKGNDVNLVFIQGSNSSTLAQGSECRMKISTPKGLWRTFNYTSSDCVSVYYSPLSVHIHEGNAREDFPPCYHPVLARVHVTSGADTFIHLKLLSTAEPLRTTLKLSTVLPFHRQRYGSGKGRVVFPWSLLGPLTVLSLEARILLAAPVETVILVTDAYVSDNLVLSPKRCLSLDFTWKPNNSVNESFLSTAFSHIHPRANFFQTEQLTITLALKCHWLIQDYRIYFSFHKVSDGPLRHPDGLWNCSAPHWPGLDVHLGCNLVTECAGGEDERDCPYTGSCGPGRLSSGDSCYVYVSEANLRSATAGDRLCERLGGHMVSLNTPEETGLVFSLLRVRRLPWTVAIGLRPVDHTFPLFYRSLQMWSDGTLAYNASYIAMAFQGCAIVYSDLEIRVTHDCIGQSDYYIYSARDVMCEVNQPGTKGPNGTRGQNSTTRTSNLKAPDLSRYSPRSGHVVCPEGHVTYSFLACDPFSACWLEGRDEGGYDVTSGAEGGYDVTDRPSPWLCPAPLATPPPALGCEDGHSRVPYPLVCDGRADCGDGSDEDFCVLPACRGDTTFMCVRTKQCISSRLLCDGQRQCPDGSDEDRCRSTTSRVIVDPLPPPAVITFVPRDRRGVRHYIPRYEALAAAGQSPVTCPDTHFRCPGDGYCLPVYLLCNGYRDCPGGRDEVSCDMYVCRGHFRCRASRVCLHPDHVCDGFLQCPRNDDELWCDVNCPANCTCHGLTFTCTHPFEAHLHPDLRYLDAGGSGMSLGQFSASRLLVYLSLQRCGLDSVSGVALPNVRSLDLSYNQLTSMTYRHLDNFSSLRSLRLSANPVTALFQQPSSTPGVRFDTLQTLVLSYIQLPTLNLGIFKPFSKLRTLNLSRSGVGTMVARTAGAEKPEAVTYTPVDSSLGEGVGITAGTSQSVIGDVGQTNPLESLQVLDVRGCPLVNYPVGVFRGWGDLREVFSDSFRLCCGQSLPKGFNQAACHAPQDQISSCRHLLGSRYLQALVAAATPVLLLGNAAGFVTRVVLGRGRLKSRLEVYLTHASLSDLCEGGYLAVLGWAGLAYSGGYWRQDVGWRHGPLCSLAAFVWLVAGQTSLALACLFTLDSLLAAFVRDLVAVNRLSRHVTCSLAWVWGAGLGLAYALNPDQRVHNRSALCLPALTSAWESGDVTVLSVGASVDVVLIVVTSAGLLVLSSRPSPHQTPAAQASMTSPDVIVVQRSTYAVVVTALAWLALVTSVFVGNYAMTLTSAEGVLIEFVLMSSQAPLRPFLYLYKIYEMKKGHARRERMRKYLKIRTKNNKMV